MTSSGSDRHQSVPDTALALCMDALKTCADGMPYDSTRLPENDIAGIVHASMMCMFRHAVWLDWAIAQTTQRKVRTRLKHVLWWGISQITFMDGIAPSTVADTAVRYVRRRYSPSEAGFINAVLREFLRTPVEIWKNLTEERAPAYVRHRIPPRLFKRWKKRFSQAELRDLCDLLLEPAPLILRRRRHTDTRVPPFLEPILPPDWCPDAQIFRCTDAGQAVASTELCHGELYVQDPATLLAPSFVTPGEGDVVADLCAAPGGKSAVMLDCIHQDIMLLCADRSPERMRMTAKNLKKDSRAALFISDVRRSSLKARSCDWVLLDVPCSNTGVIRRRPDVRQNFSIAGLRELVQLQKDILDATVPLLRDGGRLVYSTCSIEPEENGEQVREFLLRFPQFTLEAERQLFPSRAHDGAYVALVCRQAPSKTEALIPT